MLNYSEINEEINRLENANTTYSNCEKLAVLYAVSDRSKRIQPEPMYSYSAEPKTAENAFYKACKAIPIDKLLEILEEHFMAVKVLYPKEYEYVMRQIEYSNLYT